MYSTTGSGRAAIKLFSFGDFQADLYSFASHSKCHLTHLVLSQITALSHGLSRSWAAWQKLSFKSKTIGFCSQ